MICEEPKYNIREVCAFLGMRPRRYDPMSVGKGMSSGNPKLCFGHRYFQNANYLGREECAKLDVLNVVKRQAYYAGPTGTPTIAPGKQMTVGIHKNGLEEPLGMVSDQYQEIPDSEIVNVVTQAIKDTGLDIGGSYVSEKGHSTFIALIKNPEYRFDQGIYGNDRTAFLGFSASNNHLGTAACNIQVIGVDEVCWNWMAWGHILGQRKIIHEAKDYNIQEVANMLLNIMENTEVIRDKMHILQDTQVTEEEIMYLYAGIGLNATNIESLITFRDRLNPDLKDKTIMSQYDLYNAGTAYTTYRTGLSAYGAISEGEKMEKMLTMSFDKILDIGREKIDDMVYKYKKVEDKTTVPMFLKPLVN